MTGKILFAALIIAAIWWMVKPRPKPANPLPPLKIDQAEARAILGVSDAASDDDIRAAHRRLVSALHPDRGGSEELTRRINLARDTLLKRH